MANVISIYVYHPGADYEYEVSGLRAGQDARPLNRRDWNRKHPLRRKSEKWFHEELPMKRRTFLKAVSLSVVPLSARHAFASEALTPPSPKWVKEYGLTPIGTLNTKPSRDIIDSRIGIGMECLDRRMYLPEKTYGHLAALGAKWARLQTGWSRCETTEGVYDFAWLDDVVDKVIAAGVRPWFNVGYGNKLYSPDAPHESAVGQVPLYDGERGVNGWKNFLHALASHFKDRIEYWEIWNEPNISSFWHPKHKSSPVEYAKLVSISAEAIRSRHLEHGSSPARQESRWSSSKVASRPAWART